MFIRHFSGHAAVVSSAFLKLAGIDAGTPDEGGVRFDRDANGYPTGPVYELSIDLIQRLVPVMTLEDMVDAIMRVSESMASYGLTCASDMMIGHYDLEKELKAYKIACDRGAKIRFRLYAKWPTVLGERAIEPSLLKEIASGLDPAENITEKEAILAYTAGAAELNDDAGVYGKLEPGEWADFTICE